MMAPLSGDYSRSSIQTCAPWPMPRLISLRFRFLNHPRGTVSPDGGIGVKYAHTGDAQALQ